jgi:hypothetical protein
MQYADLSDYLKFRQNGFSGEAMFVNHIISSGRTLRMHKEEVREKSVREKSVRTLSFLMTQF